MSRLRLTPLVLAAGLLAAAHVLGDGRAHPFVPPAQVFRGRMGRIDRGGRGQ